MKPSGDSFAAEVAALRDLTATAADGRATRARLLIELSRRRARRSGRGRVGGLAAAALLLSSVALAYAVLDHASRLPTIRLSAHVPQERSQLRAQERSVSPPPVLAPAPLGEAVVYGRAHDAHFRGASALRALAAWDDYLRSFPNGAWVPEARFNRAISLIRLRRFRAGAQALRPFARAPEGTYRQREACLLLERLRDADPSVAPEPACSR